MTPLDRFEILETLGTGDFAIVYKARDRELNREVAIKQIHQQFLAQPGRLEGFWREAQLLASLEHPNVVTIYDIVRPSGWIVMELMQGSLPQRAAGEPMNLDYLRVALFHCLHGLKHIHQSGILHGDVKPGNLFLDRRNRVKLGDFGLARRVASDDGSLLKGTTKYMAPEVGDDRFGAVGPASDLYSLGFSAYELMCGRHFADLFPGMSAFGRDQQIAWIMWHTAADRKLPEIQRVMEGVPADLSHVIQRLCEKDPKRRYRTADDALHDLVQPGQGKSPSEQQAESAAAASAEAAKQKRKRLLAIVAMSFSLALCLLMFFMPGSDAEPQKKKRPEAQQGLVKEINAQQRTITLDVGPDQKPIEYVVQGDDEFRLNNRIVTLRDVQPRDRILVKPETRDGQAMRVFELSRPVSHAGRIQELRPSRGSFVLAVQAVGEGSLELPMTIERDAQILVNELPATIDDLQDGDLVQVTYTDEERGRYVLKLTTKRRVIEQGGVLMDVADGRTVFCHFGPDDAEPLKLPVAEDCVVTLNKLRELKGAPLKVSDLRPGDRIIRLERDTELHGIEVYRQFPHEGSLRSVAFDDGSRESGVMEVSSDEGDSVRFQVGRDCQIKLGQEQVALADLQRQDKLKITHESPDLKNLTALSIEATRPTDESQWAIVIGVSGYDDQAIPPPKTAAADARRLYDVLLKRFAVPPEQALLLIDRSRVRLEQEVKAFAAKVPATGRLLVYYGGHAFVADDQVYLAPAALELDDVAGTGLPLAALIAELESSPAKEKVLYLDACHELPAELAAQQPSSARMVELFQASVPRPALKTVTVVTSCGGEERGQLNQEGSAGLFAAELAAGLTGEADENRDGLTAIELFEHVESRLAAAGGKQRPVRFPPDTTPPRISPEARQAIVALLGLANQPGVTADEAATAFAEADDLAANEPEPRLAYALVLLQLDKFTEALGFFEDVKFERPERLLGHQGSVWIKFLKRHYADGVEGLASMIDQVPPPKKAGQQYRQDHLELFQWAGVLREFALQQRGGRSDEAFDQLDQVVAKHAPEAQQAHQAGRNEALAKILNFTKQIDAAKTEEEKTQLRLPQRSLKSYADFPLEAARESIVKGLDN